MLELNHHFSMSNSTRLRLYDLQIGLSHLFKCTIVDWVMHSELRVRLFIFSLKKLLIFLLTLKNSGKDAL